MNLKSDVKHNGKLYKKGTGLKDEKLLKLFTEKGFLVEPEKKETKKDNKKK